MINLTIDDQKITVPAGTTVYAACRQLGIDLPIFCYHDRMPPFGACRVCLVEVEKMPKPQTSCTLQVSEGMVVKTQSALAKEGRKDILEFLLINHPLDCPICDRGGECPLQDQAVKFGPGESRFFEEKRHFKKPLPLGPVLMLDRERCVVCARCTRFSDIVSGDHALEMKERGYRTEVGTPQNNPIDSKFIGNTIMICPVGALTSNVYRFRARPWDNTTTPTTCTLCPVGCSMALDSRDGEIMRTRSMHNSSVNDIWLCDKGWFGYEFASHPDRLKEPLMRKDDKLQPVTWEEAINAIAEKLKEAIPSGKIAGLGGNPLTIEESYLFQKLMRHGLHSNHVDHRVGMPLLNLSEEGLPPGMEHSIEDCKNLNFALILGADITEEFPVIWLRLKAAINCGAEIHFAGHYAPEVAPFFKGVTLHSPGQELSELDKLLSLFSSLAEKGGKGAIFIGRQYLASKQRKPILSRLLKLKSERPNLSIHIMEGKENSMGARFAGMHPELGPYEEKLNNSGYDFLKIFQIAAEEGWDYLHVAGSNPGAKLPRDLWKKARSNLKFLVVQEIFMTETARHADIVLPSLCYVEKKGHVMNISGKIQKLHPGKSIPEFVYSDEEIFKKIAEKLEIELNFDKKFAEKLFKKHQASFQRSKEIFPSTEIPININEGCLAATFTSLLFDRGARMCHNMHLRLLAKDPLVRIHPSEGDKRQLKDGDTVILRTNGANISGVLALDSRIALGTIALPTGFSELNSYELDPNLLNGASISISKQ